MINIKPQYITDENGNKISVVIPFSEFKAIIEELEEVLDIKLYDEAKAENDISIPIEQAFTEIEKNRSNS
jgi:hypothetical protein